MEMGRGRVCFRVLSSLIFEASKPVQALSCAAINAIAAQAPVMTLR